MVSLGGFPFDQIFRFEIPDMEQFLPVRWTNHSQVILFQRWKATSSTSSSTLVPQKKLHLKGPYLYEGRKKNDSFDNLLHLRWDRNIENRAN